MTEGEENADVVDSGVSWLEIVRNMWSQPADTEILNFRLIMNNLLLFYVLVNL